jgi:hypothetical protein
MNMSGNAHLVIENGIEQGRELFIPDEGARLGRSSSNDISIQDPSLSRFHCRMFFKDGALIVGDLGSSNQTMVNRSPITEARLEIGDKVLIGDTILSVINNRSATAPSIPAPIPGAAAPVEPPMPVPGPSEPVFNFDTTAPPAEEPPSPINSPSANEPLFDLGLNKSDMADPQQSKKEGQNFKPLIILLVVMIILVVGIFVIKEIFENNPPEESITTRPTQGKPAAVLYPVEINYEKIKTDPDNIFRFYINIDREGRLSAEVDNIKDNRHITKSDEQIEEDVLKNLAQLIRSENFFELQEEYTGLTKGLYDTYDLSITIGKDTHRVTVKNTTEPDSFKTVRELIEKFSEKELSLYTISRSVDELHELAYEAWLLGKRHYDEKDIEAGNLMNCIKSMNEVDLYLQSIEPKPDYYSQALTMKRNAERELAQRYDDAIFLFQKTSQAKEWEAAAAQLRQIIEMLPESDERHKDARKELLVVETYMDNQ